MFRLFRPDYYVDEFIQVRLELIESLKVSGLLIDVDNTLTGWHSMQLDERVRDHVLYLKEKGIRICLISNSDALRVTPIAKMLGVPFIADAKKPLTASFKKGAQMVSLPADKVAIVGDQLMTDMLGGGRAGLKRILVAPLPGKEFPGTKINRVIEKIIMFLANIKKYSS